MNKLNKNLLTKIMTNANVKASEQVVRNKLSEIRRDHAGVTLNAAGHLYAQSKGFSLMKYLDDEDRRSLQYVKNTVLTETSKSHIKKIKNSKGIKVSFGKSLIDDANANTRVYP